MTKMERDPRLPLFSILIVNYNYKHYLSEAVASALRQDYAAYEIVICDDGSTDGSQDVIRSLAARYPDRIKPVLKANGGVASALNAAFAAAKGDIVSLLDADDRFAPAKLSRVAEEFSRGSEIGIVVNRMIKFGDGAQMYGLIPQVGRLDRGWIRDKMLAAGGHWSFAPASGISLRRECAEDIFPIPEDRFRSEADAYIFTQAPLSWTVGAVSEPLSFYRLHGDNLTSTQHLDEDYTRRIISGLERMHDTLETAARKRGLPSPRLETNPTYAEMAFLRDYVAGVPRREVISRLYSFWRSAYGCHTADWLRWRLKPPVLSVIGLLPRSVGVKALEGMYLPSEWRQRMAKALLKRRR